ncbi:MAG: polyamine ABC transporter ATP-binding protein [Methylobacterium sp.]|nr:MAG: polyamine ABC transporter ATP-binding protein [Methylobacterium sp.]
MSERRGAGPVRCAFAPWLDRAAKPLVSFRNVRKSFGALEAVAGVDLDLYPGEFFALLGPSGCGKTTLMRMLAGFEEPDQGDILLDGRSVLGVPAHQRPTNLMFQSYALFPHMNVEQNIAYGLKQEGLPRAEITARVEEVLGLVRLADFGKRRPDQLSGGQKQRVALARAIAKRPRVLLLDEPLGALDRKLREETQYELVALQEKLGLAFLMVTHDQDEAMTMAHRIGVMQKGRLAQVGTPGEIYEAPATRAVAEFVGDITIVEAIVTQVAGEVVTLRHPIIGPIELDDEGEKPAPGANVHVGLRPEKIALSAIPPHEPVNRVEGIVWDIGYLGDMTMVQVKLADGSIMRVSVTNRARRAERPLGWDDRVWLSWDVEAPILLDSPR